jgi:hypothetical protein
MIFDAVVNELIVIQKMVENRNDRFPFGCQRIVIYIDYSKCWTGYCETILALEEVFLPDC